MQGLFGSRGKRLRFDPDGYYTYQNIHLGDDVVIGRGATLMAAESKIIIGDKVMFGPEVMLIAGNHNTGVQGQAMFDVKEKRPEDDQDIVIEDDVWVGARAIILKGVVVRRGAIIAAGALVTREVPPYAVVAGNPARVIRFRWTPDEILSHERSLYPTTERLSRQLLEEAQNRSNGALEQIHIHAG
jgi:maltose O-acetyltransferase